MEQNGKFKDRSELLEWKNIFAKFFFFFFEINKRLICRLCKEGLQINSDRKWTEGRNFKKEKIQKAINIKKRSYVLINRNESKSNAILLYTNFDWKKSENKTSADGREWDLGYVAFLMPCCLSLDWCVTIFMSNLALCR